MLEALGFFALMEAAGLAAAPLAALVLGRLPGAGLGFAKVLGVLLVGWLVVDGRQHRARGLRPGDDRRRVRASSPLLGALAALAAAAARRGGCASGPTSRRAGGSPAGAARRLAAQALPAEDPRAAAAVGRLGGGVRGRVRRRWRC